VAAAVFTGVLAILQDPMAAETDTELMVAVRDGDLVKLGVLFERHHVGLFNFFLRLTGNRPLSEDLVQEAFIRILKYRKTFRQPGEFRPWLFKLARNAVAAHFRKHGRDHLPPAEPDEPVCESPLAIEELERAENASLLRAALLRLPYDRREVLLLSRFGELRYDQIAGLLGCSVGAVKLRVHRAVKELREVFDGIRRTAPLATRRRSP
jgi:RNA polymerase sigma factor (sigma-70 family)